MTEVPGYQGQVAIASDGADGLIATWNEDRTGNPVVDDTHFDVYGQHLNGAGARLWTAGGISVASVAGGQLSPHVILDGQRGWIVAWFDRRDPDPQIYAQRLDTNGALQWKADGVQIMNQSIDILHVGMISDADGGAILTWSDRRFPPYLSVFAQRVGRNGRLGVPGGPRLRTDADEQTVGWLTSRWIQNQMAIQFALPRSGPVRLDVHDVSGRRVRSWREDFVEAGVHEHRFDVTDDRGRVLPAGVYFVNLDSSSGRLNQRLIVTK